MWCWKKKNITLKLDLTKVPRIFVYLLDTPLHFMASEFLCICQFIISKFTLKWYLGKVYTEARISDIDRLKTWIKESQHFPWYCLCQRNSSYLKSTYLYSSRVTKKLLLTKKSPTKNLTENITILRAIETWCKGVCEVCCLLIRSKM